MNRRDAIGLLTASGLAAARQVAVNGSSPSTAVVESEWPVDTQAPPLSMLDMVKRAGFVPDFLKEDWRREATNRALHQLDMDVAAMKSTSLAAKVNIQIARNLREIERNFWADNVWEKTWGAFTKKWGGA